MSPFAPSRQHRIGSLLVALQFGLLSVLAIMAGPRLLRGDIPAASVLLAVLSVGLGVWTLAYNRLGNFNIHPVPKAGGRLVTGGPYRLIRHPMYSAVLLGAAALASCASPWLGWSTWFALVLVLWLKSSLEESWLCDHHSQYQAYCLSSRRFVPWLF